MLKSVSVEVRPGEVVGLLGPNGAGKTTTFYCVVGLARPDAGAVLLGDRDLTRRADVPARASRHQLPAAGAVGVPRPHGGGEHQAILETLPITREARRARLEELLEELSIAHLANSYASALSGGERRRLEITRALVTAPSFIFSTNRSPALIRSR